MTFGLGVTHPGAEANSRKHETNEHLTARPFHIGAITLRLVWDGRSI